MEAARLADAGVPDALARLSVSERALVVTPFHQAANRLRELARGAGRHGSCGVGVGEAVADAVARPEEALRMGDIRDGERLRGALRRLQADKRAELAPMLGALAGVPAADAERRVLEEPSVATRWIDAALAVTARVAVVGDAWLGDALQGTAAAVFEGAQGVLLDEWIGFHPHTTYSTCTFENALDLLRAHAPRARSPEIIRVGVIRTYLVRHGQGPLPTEDAALRALPEPHNADGPWQGRVRRGWPDALLAAMPPPRATASTPSPLPTSTRSRARPPGAPATPTGSRAPLPRSSTRRPTRASPWAFAFRRAATWTARPPSGRRSQRRPPVHEAAPWGAGAAGEEAAIAFFEEAIGAPVRIEARGPSARDVRWRRRDGRGGGSPL